MSVPAIGVPLSGQKSFKSLQIKQLFESTSGSSFDDDKNNKNRRIMKKIYMNPTMKVVEIQCRQMLTTSDPRISGNSYSGGDILAPGRNNIDDFDDFDE